MLVRLILVLGTVAIGCSAQQLNVGFAVVGVASGQTARINVLNEAPSAPAALAAQNATSCPVVMQFLGADGKVLKELSLEHLKPGTIASVDLVVAGERTPVRATVRAGYAGGANPPPGTLEGCRVVPNLELFSTKTGRTQMLLTETRPLVMDFRLMPQ